MIQLVAAPGDTHPGWDGAGAARVPAEHAVRGLHLVTLSEASLEPTQRMLADLLGIRAGTEDGDRTRFTMGTAGSVESGGGIEGTAVDVTAATREGGLVAGGTVHHIAFRAVDGATQARWRAQLVEPGVQVTEIIDRQYFTSIYFREPGGCCWRSPPTSPGSPSTSPCWTWAAS